MLTLDRLRYFVEVAHREHVHEAAKALAVSPSVISSAIATLEAEFAQSLFLRENQRLKLNDKGRVLLEEATKLLESANRLYDCFEGNPTKLKGHFKLGASHFLMKEHLIPAVLKLQKKNPELTFELLSVDSGVATANVLSGLMDAALIFRSSYYHDLDETILHEGQFQIAVRKNHPILKTGKKSVVKELNSLPAITFRTSTGANFWEAHPAFKTHHIVPKHTFFYEDTQTAIQLLSKTDGWAFLPDIVINETKEIVSLDLMTSHAPVNVSLVRNRSRAMTLVFQELMEFFKQEICFSRD